MRLILTPLLGIPLISIGMDLNGVISRALDESGLGLESGDVLVVAQKIVSKAEGRLVALDSITPSRKARRLAREAEKDPRLVELILQESEEILRVRPGLIIVEHRLGFVCANAGIDRSNVGPGPRGEERVLLLPENPGQSAARVRAFFEEERGLSIGVLIIDSHGRAWRLGTVGTAIGFAGLPGLVDLRGRPDLFSYTLQATEVGAADELAAAASLLMGQAAEGTPVVHVRGFPYGLREGGLSELLRPKADDLFR